MRVFLVVWSVVVLGGFVAHKAGVRLVLRDSDNPKRYSHRVAAWSCGLGYCVAREYAEALPDDKMPTGGRTALNHQPIAWCDTSGSNFCWETRELCQDKATGSCTEVTRTYLLP